MKTAILSFITLLRHFLSYMLVSAIAEFSLHARNPAAFRDAAPDAGKPMENDPEDNPLEFLGLNEELSDDAEESEESDYSEFYEYIERTYGL